MVKKPKPSAAPPPLPDAKLKRRRRRRPAGSVSLRTYREIQAVKKASKSTDLLFRRRRIERLLEQVKAAEISGAYEGTWKQLLRGRSISMQSGVVDVARALVERRLQKVMTHVKCLQQASQRITATPEQLIVAVKLADMVH